MAGNPATALSLELHDHDVTVVPILPAASRLIDAAFGRPAMQMTTAFLEWHLTGFEVAGLRPLVVTARHGDALAGFAAATPRPLRCDGLALSAYLVSFVCVRSDLRGFGVSQRLYDTLLPAIRERSGRVLTFAIDGSAGMRAIGAAYRRHGYREAPLGVLAAWGAMRGRIRAPAEPSAPLFEAPVLTLDVDRSAGHLARDPRGSIAVGDHGARVVLATRLTTSGTEPYLLLDVWPEPATSRFLNEACSEALIALPDHGNAVIVANVPVTADAARAGLRRVAGPAYQAWSFAVADDDPLLRMRSTSHPII